MNRLIDKERSDLISLVSQFKNSKDYTFFLEVSSACGATITVDQKRCVNFVSNNYLGFSTHKRVVKAVTEALQKYGLGIGGAPIACGTTELHYRLIDKINEVYGTEDSVIFTTGYQALLGTVQACVGKKDVALLDNLVHRSIVDGIVLSGCEQRLWMHNDMEDLEELLQSIGNSFERKLIIVDSVYSMDGDIAKLPELIRLKEKYDAILLIDEAHSLGILGENGLGLPDHFQITGGVDVIAGTFSKFAGAIGGFAAASTEFIEYLKHSSTPHLFSASLSPLICAGILESFKVLEEEPEWREKLWINVRFLLKELKALGFNTGRSETPVIPIIVKDVAQTLRFAKGLLENGIYVSPIVYPAVSPANSRVRLGVMATHSREDLEKSLEMFEKVGKQLSII
ncbi:aminotransferase class I/II-fold pyridoxal phosphate-dependent enzyme [bacterium]|nr:aminotransferase class I/II-fold pyridoxal phosphate-dependent enzyme [bacterium]